MTEGHIETLEEAAENTKPISELADGLVNAAVASTASDTGRTVEEQWERMGDKYAFEAVEQDPYQKQLVDYAISGDTVEVRR
jgi:hypothetical protein